MSEWDDWVAAAKQIEMTTMNIAMPADLKEEADRIVAAEEWGEEGLLRIFATGVAFIKGEREISRISGNSLDPTTKEDAERAVRLLLEESSRFAALRFKAYRIAEDNQTLTMRATGWQRDAEMLGERVKRFREDEERLKARVRELEAENLELRALVTAEQPSRSPTRRSLLARLLGSRPAASR
jgi:hypothetical protein